ncbi:MAG: DUF6624 domain-containing protein [Planctomycetota bacterium]
MENKQVFLFCFAIVAVLLSYLGGTNSRMNKIKGSWKSEDGSLYLTFSNKKVIWCKKGKLVVFNARYFNSAFKLKNWMVTYGREIKYKYRLENSKLYLREGASKEYILSRIERPPRKCLIIPLKLGKKVQLTQSQSDKIKLQLKKRGEADQAVRTNLQKAVKSKEVDRSNSNWLIRLVRKIGWIDVKRFGEEASKNAFLIVQHSRNVRLMLAVLPEIEKDVKAGLMDPQSFSLLYDRTKLYLAQKQRYGTQIITTATGKRVIPAVESKDKIDDYRSAIGLFPLSLYLQILKRVTGMQESEEIEILEE